MRPPSAIPPAKRKEPRTALFVCLTVLTAGALFASEPDIRAGEWEITTRAEQPGGMSLPTITYRTFLRSDFLRPHPRRYGRQCRIVATDSARKGVFRWRIKCRHGEILSVRGSVRYSRENFESNITLVKTSVYRHESTIVNHIRGIYRGPLRSSASRRREGK